jgi:hypothetical protein
VSKKRSGGSQADGIRGTLWYFYPHELTVVGHDTDERDHELCHDASNVFDAEHYDEYISYMRLNGIDKPILFRRDGDRVLVVEGRTTTRVARVVAPLWEQDRKAEGLKGDDAKLRIPAVLRRGTAEQLFCASRATNRRRREDPVLDQAKDVARLTNAGVPVDQAAVKLGLPLARAKQLIAFLDLHPKAQRRVGVDVSLDAAAKLAKLPQSEQVAKLDEIVASGAKPTARKVRAAVTGGEEIMTPGQRIGEAIRKIDAADRASWPFTAQALLDEIRAVLKPSKEVSP